MADKDKRLTLTVDWPEITIESLSRISSLWAQLIQSVGAEATGKRTAIKWVVKSISFSSPLKITADPEVTSDRIAPVVAMRVSTAVVEGMRHLLTYPDQPNDFSHDSLHLARKLALLADPLQHRRLSISNGTSDQIEVSTRVAATVDAIFGPVVESYGTVEGTLEGVLTHGRKRFYVYETLTNRQVRCLFDDIPTRLPEILQAFEQRVSVSGRIKSKALTGEKISVEAKEFSVFRSDRELLSLAEIQKLWSPR